MSGTSMRRSRRAEDVEAGGGAHPLRERALAGAANDGPVGERVGKGNPELEQVGAAVDGRLGERGRVAART